MSESKSKKENTELKSRLYDAVGHYAKSDLGYEELRCRLTMVEKQLVLGGTLGWIVAADGGTFWDGNAIESFSPFGEEAIVFARKEDAEKVKNRLHKGLRNLSVQEVHRSR